MSELVVALTKDSQVLHAVGASLRSWYDVMNI